jgi:hypothetical protein
MKDCFPAKINLAEKNQQTQNKFSEKESIKLNFFFHLFKKYLKKNLWEAFPEKRGNV